MIKINNRIFLIFLLLITVLLATSIVSATDSDIISDTSSSNSLDDSNSGHSEDSSNTVTNNQDIKSNDNTVTQEVKKNNNTVTSNKELKSSSNTEETKSDDNIVTSTSSNNNEISTQTNENNNNEVKTQESTQSSQNNSVNNSVVDSKTDLKENIESANDYSKIEKYVADSSISQINLVNYVKYRATDTITIDRIVTINGCGATIYGEGLYTIFNVTNRGYLTLINVTITNCSSTNGGAIYNTGNLTLTDTTFSYNTATNNGGAIYNEKNSRVMITNSTFKYNNATNGGAIYNCNSGNVSLEGTNLTNNKATAYGNSIYNSGLVKKYNTSLINEDIYNSSTGEYLIFYNKPSLSFSFDTSTPYIGGYITLSGRLTENQKNLTQKDINIIIGGQSVTIKTDNEGKYSYKYYTNTLGRENVTITYEGDNDHFRTSYTKTYNVTEFEPNIAFDTLDTKIGYTVTFTVYIYLESKAPVNTGQVVFKMNGKTITVDGNPLKVDVVNGIVRVNYTIPNYTPREYEITAVYGYNNVRLEKTCYMIIFKQDPSANISSITSNGNTGKITGNLLDEHGANVNKDTKVAVKINGKTVTNTVIYNGKIDITFNTSAYKTGIHNITIKFGQNSYFYETSFEGIIAQNLKDTVVVDQVTSKNGYNVTLRAYFVDENGNTINNGTATFKLNGVTIKSNSSQIKVNITNGVAEYRFTIPEYSAKDYNLTAVGSIDGVRYENKTTLTIEKLNTYISLSSISSFYEGLSFTLKGYIKDELNRYVTADTKISVKINNITVLNTRVSNGIINETIHTSKYSNGTYNITVIAGENGRYNTSECTTNFTIKAKRK